MSAVAGMSLEDAANFVVEQARAAVAGGMKYGVWTVMGNRSVLVGVAIPGGHAAAILVPIERYDGMKLIDNLVRCGG